MTIAPTHADPEVAAETFAVHLENALASAPALASGWTATVVSPLEAVVHLIAERTDGTTDAYHLKLDARWYDQFPPQAAFVKPPNETETDWSEARPGSRWMPNINNGVWPDGRFAFHPAYAFGAVQRQLICCSMSFDYYISGHTPNEAQRWRQGRHTLVALLNRVQEALRPPAYEGPSGDHDS